MKHILFLYPYNRRTIPIDVALNELIKEGYKITLLTFSSKGDLHTIYQNLGCEVYSNVIENKNPFWVYLKQIIYLVRFCKKHKIDFVFAHLQEAMLIGSLAQFFSKSKFIMFRHHCYYEYLKNNTHLKPNKNLIIGDKIVNKLAKTIVVPSFGVMNPMIHREGVEKEKIKIIPYIYDISNMTRSVNLQQAQSIRSEFNCELLVIMVSRLIPYKQHFDTLPVFKNLIERGYDIKVMIMDDSGWEGKRIQQYINEHNLEKRIFMLGFKKNILDYFTAADVLVHPSLTEASCSATKEAGLLEKLVIVNSHVGDFDDYIINNETGFSLDANKYNDELKEVLEKVYQDKSIIKNLGLNLKNAVIKQFAIRNEVIDKYKNLIK